MHQKQHHENWLLGQQQPFFPLFVSHNPFCPFTLPANFVEQKLNWFNGLTRKMKFPRIVVPVHAAIKRGQQRVYFVTPRINTALGPTW